MVAKRITLLVALACSAVTLVGGPDGPRYAWADEDAAKTTKLEQRLALLGSANTTFAKLAGEQAPKDASAKDKQAWADQTAWLESGIRRFEALVAVGNAALAQAKAKSKSFPEQYQLFTAQYIALQQELQKETQQLTAVSNVLKTRHDTAKNTISNLR
jgi:hypothetical protein